VADDIANFTLLVEVLPNCAVGDANAITARDLRQVIVLAIRRRDRPVGRHLVGAIAANRVCGRRAKTGYDGETSSREGGTCKFFHLSLSFFGGAQAHLWN
jgi:hypothetical protein